MVAALDKVLAGVQPGIGFGHGRLTLVPLYLNQAARLDCLLLDEAVGQGVVEVRETTPSGSVPHLMVHNHGQRRLLIPDGSTLVGCKQNRVVNLTILLKPASQTVIPVSCVERRRWSTGSAAACGGQADNELRRKMCLGATKSLKATRQVHVDQGDVWAHVDGMLGASGSQSPTAAYDAVYEKRDPDLAEYEARLPCPNNASGVAVLIEGKVEAFDLFDKPGTLQRLWPRLVRGYAVNALWNSGHCGRHTDVAEFLASTKTAQVEGFDAIGLGENLRLESDEIAGAALVYDNDLVHLSLFANQAPISPRDEGNAAVEPRPSSPRDRGKPADKSPPKPAKRPWWRRFG